MGPDTDLSRILVVHAEYRQAGGEEAVVAAEVGLLRAHGLAVEELRFDNAAWAASMGVAADVRRAVETVWSARARKRAAAAVAAFRPHLVHVHNTFPSASPAIYSALHRRGVPIVQTLHNYRLLCPVATFFRDGRPCTDCLGKGVPWPGLVHACYRGSRAASGAVVVMLAIHNAMRTWHRHIDRFIALSASARDLFQAGGLPADLIAVIPNFLEPDPGMSTMPRTGLLYAGRLSEEKGLRVLLQAAQTIAGHIRVAGGGPLSFLIEDAARDGTIEYLGDRDRSTLFDDLRGATALVMPSMWFEPFGMVILEAFATGTPVIASRIGAIAEIIADGETGLLVDPGDPSALAGAMRWALEHQREMVRMGHRARQTYEERYRGPAHIAALLDTYELAATEPGVRTRG